MGRMTDTSAPTLFTRVTDMVAEFIDWIGGREPLTIPRAFYRKAPPEDRAADRPVQYPPGHRPRAAHADDRPARRDDARTRLQARPHNRRLPAPHRPHRGSDG